MQKKKITIHLSASERATLENSTKRGVQKARTIVRARILLLSHKQKTNKEIMEALGCSHDLISSVRKRYVERGSIEAAIHDASRPGQPKKITAEHEAFVTATACTDAPEAHNHWTLKALKETLLETHTDLESVSNEWIRQMLLRAKLKPWREKNVVYPKAHA
jgi:putative transposase